MVLFHYVFFRDLEVKEIVKLVESMSSELSVPQHLLIMKEDSSETKDETRDDHDPTLLSKPKDDQNDQKGLLLWNVIEKSTQGECSFWMFIKSENDQTT